MAKEKGARSLLKNNTFKDIMLIVVGTFIYSLSMNLIVIPYGMYSGGFLGIAQLLREGIIRVFPSLTGFGNLEGYIYFALNVPLLILALINLGKKFFVKTAICVGFYSLFLAAIPIPKESIFDERIAACLVGGVLCGIGDGIALSSGCSGGGEEIIGLLCAKKNKWFSVGKMAMMINIMVFGTGIFVFNLKSVVYSILMAVMQYTFVDKVHQQNVFVTMFIITKTPEMEQLVFEKAGRGVTKWKAEGAYSNEHADVLMTVCSKKEAGELKKELRKQDENVFVMICNDISVVGNFKKRI